MVNCPNCGTVLPAESGTGWYCTTCGESGSGTRLAAPSPGHSSASTHVYGVIPSQQTFPPVNEPTRIFAAGEQAQVGASPGPGAGDDPFAAFFRPAPGERSPHTMTQVIPTIPQQAGPSGAPGTPPQPDYDQPINYQTGPGRPYSEPYEGPYADDYATPTGRRPRSSRGPLIGVGAAAAAILVVVVSLITLGSGKSTPSAQNPAPGQIVIPTATQAARGSSHAPAQSGSSAPSGNSTSSSVQTPGSLQMGDSGPQVKALQERLKQLHLYSGPINSTFDQATAQAVAQFQAKAHASDPAGVVGRSTRTALVAAGSKPNLSIFSGAGKKPHQNPDDVKRLQRALASALNANIPASGNYDTTTIGAVMRYQTAVGLFPDGLTGDKVWSALQSGRLG